MPPATPLEQVLELARSAREDAVATVLEVVADTVVEICRFRTVAVNVYRPAWDDYEVVLTRGGPEIDAALLGTRLSAHSIARLRREARALGHGMSFLTVGDVDWIEHRYVPALPHPVELGAWGPQDSLFVPLSDTAGVPLGFLSIDEPESGQRPGPEELRVLRAISLHAAQALERARDRHRDEAEAAMNTALLAASPAIAACAGTAELMELTAATITGHLGFERAAIYLRGDGEHLGLAAHAGAGPGASDELDAGLVASVLGAALPATTCRLARAAELFPGRADPSPRNGRGAGGWSDHCLLAPLSDAAGHVVGVIAVEDPVDHARPPERRRQLVRLLADATSAAWTNLRTREIQEQLLAAVRLRDEGQSLAAALAGAIRAPVCVLDASAVVLAAAPHGAAGIEVPDRAELERATMAGDVGRIGSLIVQPLELDGSIAGWLLAGIAPRPEPIAPLAVAQAASLFSLQLSVTSYREGVEQRLRGSLIDELLDDPGRLDAIDRRARRLGHDLGSLAHAVAIVPRATAEQLAAPSTFTYLVRATRDVFAAHDSDGIIAVRGEAVLLFIGPLSREQAITLGRELLDRVRVRTGLDATIGVSRRVRATSGLGAAIREALAAARGGGDEARVILADEVGLHQMLLTAAEREDVEDAARRLLAPVWGETPARRRELLATLAAYLEETGNLESVARRLNLHVNSVRYRLGRLEELLAVDLRDARVRIDLQLALDVLGPDPD